MSVRDIVNTWFRECLASGAIARNTPAYNQAFSSLPDLIARLEASEGAPAAVDPAPPTPKATPKAAAGKASEGVSEAPSGAAPAAPASASEAKPAA